ncbi:DUF2975 domain-containing protein [Erythrobacter aquimaris]|uniref:DUF2975 domain-containing protein n=1 Tax=Qipengyuania aquimaris TaxID=255984 RepID=A0A6I4TRY1_9SPHN|nr:DUF2975 domain-containing protein [Qipengyuania aquimaris]MXO97173.1 DUF2975 domain-containing protein [Qipengyuania aquimaris]
MTSRKSDPLLTAGKIMTVLLMAITALVAMLLVTLVPFLLFHKGDFAATVAAAGGSYVPALMLTILVLASIACVVMMAFHFFQLLGRLIDTVSQGDPFTNENAQRLTRMGWIALIFQIASFPIAAMAVYLQKFFPAEELSIDIDFSLTGVLLAIVLFILARVFRHGAAMREDLEGTV